MGRVLNHTQCTPKSCSGTPFSVSYSYDLAGNLLTGSNGVGVTLSYGYDAAARPTQVVSSMNDSQHPATLATIDPSVGYYPTGGLRKLTFANNLTQTAVFNSLLQPCRVNVNSSGTALGACADAIPSGNVQDFNYTFASGSNNGNVTSWTAVGAQAFTRAFSYDALNRLSTLNQTSGNATGCGSAFSVSWNYDAWGNRTDQNVTSGSCNAFHASVDANNRLSGAPYQYDAAGNLTQDASHHYFYDAENRLVQVEGTFGTCSTATACYLYDALGHRVEKQTGSAYVDYVHDLDGNVVSEYCTNCSGYTGWSEGYVYLGGSLLAQYAQGTTFFAHSDHLGSTRLLTGLGSNLVSNAGFESGETNWSSNNASLIVAVTDPTRAHSGSGYIQISESDPSTGPSIVGQPIAVQAGDQITFGGWVYLESGGGGALGWWMETMDANHNVTNWIGAGASPTTSGWTLQSNTYTIPSGVAYVALYATNWKPTSPAVIRVDDGFLIDNRSSLQITQSLDYLPFGELNSSDSAVTSHKFTGLERDGETGLDHTLFRKYSSTLGRWTTPDPASLSVASPAFPQSWNRYAYVENDPMDWIDPLGLCKNKPCMTGPQCRYPQNWSHCDHEPIALAEYCGITGELCASNNPNAANCTSFGIAVPCGSIGNGFAAISVIDYGKDPDLCIPNPSLCTTIFLIDLGTGGRGGGNTSGNPRCGAPPFPSCVPPTVSATPKLTFRPPSWQNFTHQFLPCYGGQLLGNFLGNDDQAGVTAGTIALASKLPKLGGPLLVLWTGLNAFKAGSDCAVASRAVYQ
jgi:RHS repeat-associated protein